MDLRSTSSAVLAVSAVCAAAVEPREATPPASTAPSDVSADRHIHWRRDSKCPWLQLQQSITFSSKRPGAAPLPAVALHQASRHQRPAVDQHEENQLERQ